jgi:hypothetical protein
VHGSSEGQIPSLTLLPTCASDLALAATGSAVFACSRRSHQHRAALRAALIPRRPTPSRTIFVEASEGPVACAQSGDPGVMAVSQADGAGLFLCSVAYELGPMAHGGVVSFAAQRPPVGPPTNSMGDVSVAVGCALENVTTNHATVNPASVSPA